MSDDFRLLDRFFVGFDGQLDRLARMHDEYAKRTNPFPPYNIKKLDSSHYLIEVAVAGFAKEDLDISVEEDRLTIKGSTKPETHDEETHYVFKGIAARDFTRTFTLEDNVEVRGADIVNGMLQISLERVVPEHQKPRKIEIGEGLRTVQPPKQLLQEQN